MSSRPERPPLPCHPDRNGLPSRVIPTEAARSAHPPCHPDRSGAKRRGVEGSHCPSVDLGSPAAGCLRGDPSARSLRSLGRDDRRGVSRPERPPPLCHPQRREGPTLPVIPTGAARSAHPSCHPDRSGAEGREVEGSPAASKAATKIRLPHPAGQGLRPTEKDRALTGPAGRVTRRCRIRRGP